MAGSVDGHSRQREQLLQRFWGKNELDMFKESRESQCSWNMVGQGTAEVEKETGTNCVGPCIPW